MIAIVDYGVGNLFSLQSSLRCLGAEARVTGRAEELRQAERIILPGVGAFGNARAKLDETGLVPVLLERSAIPGEKKAHDLTKQERRRLLELFKCFSVAVSGPRPVEEAIVTAGGVKVSEADPRTMQSKKVPGLFFAGELLDVDAYTGGFNLQIAWATGRAAGEGAAAFIDQAAT